MRNFSLHRFSSLGSGGRAACPATTAGARGAHLVTAVFLTGLGIAYLQQTEWVVSAWNWISGH